ncbi:MAG: hypothetical protein M1829_005124 [Trizodia sp. TS-e1964]|nr:MAG: hypothetical protein M1829_005124 [Trizodia sp. TS-e1964]
MLPIISLVVCIHAFIRYGPEHVRAGICAVSVLVDSGRYLLENYASRGVETLTRVPLWPALPPLGLCFDWETPATRTVTTSLAPNVDPSRLLLGFLVLFWILAGSTLIFAKVRILSGLPLWPTRVSLRSLPAAPSFARKLFVGVEFTCLALLRDFLESAAVGVATYSLNLEFVAVGGPATDFEETDLEAEELGQEGKVLAEVSVEEALPEQTALGSPVVAPVATPVVSLALDFLLAVGEIVSPVPELVPVVSDLDSDFVSAAPDLGSEVAVAAPLPSATASDPVPGPESAPDAAPVSASDSALPVALAEEAAPTISDAKDLLRVSREAAAEILVEELVEEVSTIWVPQALPVGEPTASSGESALPAAAPEILSAVSLDDTLPPKVSRVPLPVSKSAAVLAEDAKLDEPKRAASPPPVPVVPLPPVLAPAVVPVPVVLAPVPAVLAPAVLPAPVVRAPVPVLPAPLVPARPAPLPMPPHPISLPVDTRSTRENGGTREAPRRFKSTSTFQMEQGPGLLGPIAALPRAPPPAPIVYPAGMAPVMKWGKFAVETGGARRARTPAELARNGKVWRDFQEQRNPGPKATPPAPKALGAFPPPPAIPSVPSPAKGVAGPMVAPADVEVRSTPWAPEEPLPTTILPPPEKGVAGLTEAPADVKASSTPVSVAPRDPASAEDGPTGEKFFRNRRRGVSSDEVARYVARKENSAEMAKDYVAPAKRAAQKTPAERVEDAEPEEPVGRAGPGEGEIKAPAERAAKETPPLGVEAAEPIAPVGGAGPGVEEMPNEGAGGEGPEPEVRDTKLRKRRRSRRQKAKNAPGFEARLEPVGEDGE